jgi:hypothetical protein
VTTPADVAGYRQVELALHRKYSSELRSVTEGISGSSAARQRDILLRAFPELVLPGVKAMQDFASSWAEDLYAEQSIRVGGARLVLPDDDVLEATVRWAIAPAFGAATGTVFANLSGAGQRYIADAGRAVVAEISPRQSRSVARTFLRRFPDDDACDWCLLTADVTTGSHDNCHCVIAPVFERDPI